MTHPTDRQRALACRALLSHVGLTSLWSFEGPTDRAAELLEAGGGNLSSGEAIMLDLSWAVWNGNQLKHKNGGYVMGFRDLINRLDQSNLQVVGSLLVAIAQGPERLDEWIKTHLAG